MVVPVSDLMEGTIALFAVGTGFTFHLGWRHGWSEGFRAGNRIETTKDGEEHQPAVKNLFGFLYALGWHLGWDYGFRKGSNGSDSKAKKRAD
jgi:hypothetical protein